MKRTTSLLVFLLVSLLIVAFAFSNVHADKNEEEEEAEAAEGAAAAQDDSPIATSVDVLTKEDRETEKNLHDEYKKAVKATREQKEVVIKTKEEIQNLKEELEVSKEILDFLNKEAKGTDDDWNKIITHIKELYEQIQKELNSKQETLKEEEAQHQKLSNIEDKKHTDWKADRKARLERINAGKSLKDFYNDRKSEIEDLQQKYEKNKDEIEDQEKTLDQCIQKLTSCQGNREEKIEQFNQVEEEKYNAQKKMNNHISKHRASVCQGTMKVCKIETDEEDLGFTTYKKAEKKCEEKPKCD